MMEADDHAAIRAAHMATHKSSDYAIIIMRHRTIHNYHISLIAAQRSQQ